MLALGPLLRSTWLPPLPSRLPLSAHHTQARRSGKRAGDRNRSRPTRGRPSGEVSDYRHRQRWTPADTHGRSAASHACCGAGSPRRNLASGRRGRAGLGATETWCRVEFYSRSSGCTSTTPVRTRSAADDHPVRRRPE